MRSLLACALLAASVAAQGADVIVGDLPAAGNYGTLNGESAFSLATTSCNVGSVPLAWFALPSTNHPVIAQDLYRIKDGRFTQIGMSWLKHGFTALNQNLCAPCNPTPGTTLGVGCSDPYSAGLNGSQSNLGPRSDIEAVSGTFPAPNPPAYSTLLDRRLRVRNTDLDPLLNAGATYLAEGHYIAADDHQAGHALNNASWRPATFSASGTGGFNMTLTGATVREQAAIEGWPSIDPSVQVVAVDVPGDGRILVAYRGEQLPSGEIRHFFAIENYNSHRCVESLTLNFPFGSSFSNPWFHKVDHHSGEPYTNAPWTHATTAAGITWTNDAPYAVDPNANAIRWGTCYSFEVESDRSPVSVSLGLFRPGTPSSVSVTGLTFAGPPPWQTNSAEAHLDFDGLSNTGTSGPIVSEVLPGTLVTANLDSTLSGAPFDLATTPVPPVPAQLLTPSGQRINVDVTQLSWAFGFFALPMPPGGLTIPFITPPSFPIGFGAQMVVVDPASPDGVHYSAPVDFNSRPCQPGTQTLALGDDDTAVVQLGPGTAHPCASEVPFGGTTWSSFRVHANGSITFGGNPTGLPPTTVQNFLQDAPRIAAMWTDLDPSQGGTVTVSSTSTGLVSVAWSNVPTAGLPGSASSVGVNFDPASGSFNIATYSPDAAHALPTLVGVKTGLGLVSGTSVNFGNLSFGGPQSGTAGTAVYQLTSSAAPTGYSLILFPNADESSFTVY